MHSSADDVNQDPPSPVAKAPDIGPHLNTFNTFGYQIAGGMVRDGFQRPAGCYQEYIRDKSVQPRTSRV